MFSGLAPHGYCAHNARRPLPVTVPDAVLGRQVLREAVVPGRLAAEDGQAARIAHGRPQLLVHKGLPVVRVDLHVPQRPAAIDARYPPMVPDPVAASGKPEVMKLKCIGDTILG